MASTLMLAAVAGTLTAQIVTVIIAFFATMWVLKTFAWGPVIKMLDDRRDEIIKEFASIDSRQSELNSRIADYEERLRQIDQEARLRLNAAIDDGKKVAADLMEEARKGSEELKAKAAADIRVEMDKARVQLRDEVVTLTIQATEKLLHETLDAAKHRGMVNEFITELQQRKAS